MPDIIRILIMRLCEREGDRDRFKRPFIINTKMDEKDFFFKLIFRCAPRGRTQGDK